MLGCVEQSLGAYVVGIRSTRQMSQAELARRANMSASHLAQIERGNIALPSADVRRRLARALGVHHLDLLVAAGELEAEEISPVVGELTRDDDGEAAHLISLLRTAHLEPVEASIVRGLLEDAQRPWSERAEQVKRGRGATREGT